MLVPAPAKVNLRLRVHGREPSGFHPIETVFCALDLADEVEVELTGGESVRLDLEGPDLGPPERNLAVRAAEALLREAGLRQGVRIALRKRIPAGGGLGGGSSDAAAVLRALDRLLPGAVSSGALHGLAATLGSDVPFFLAGSPLAAGLGRGDVLTPLPGLPAAPVVLAIPPFGIATGEAYGWLDADRGDRAAGASLEAVPPPASWEDAAREAVNDFEGSVYRRHPVLGRVRDALRAAGARIALLSGSGSTVFGIFGSGDAAARAARAVRAAAPDVEVRITATAR